jgi:hypothetical protein
MGADTLIDCENNSIFSVNDREINRKGGLTFDKQEIILLTR